MKLSKCIMMVFMIVLGCGCEGNISRVKETPLAYGLSIGEIFGGYSGFDKVTWHYFVTEDKAKIVEFRGTYKDEMVSYSKKAIIDLCENKYNRGKCDDSKSLYSGLSTVTFVGKFKLSVNKEITPVLCFYGFECVYTDGKTLMRQPFYNHRAFNCIMCNKSKDTILDLLNTGELVYLISG